MLRTRFVWLGLLTDYTVRTLVVVAAVWLGLLTDYTVRTLVVVAAFVIIFFVYLVFCTNYRGCRRNYKSAQGRVTSLPFKSIYHQ